MKNFYTKKEYQDISKIFNLGNIKNIVYFKQGYQTPKVAITTSKGKFIIAKHNLSNKKVIVADMKIVPRIALNHEINFLQTLKNLPVPHYIKSKKENYLENFKNYTVSVYKFLPGRHPLKITPRMIYSLGEFVGQFHKKGLKFKKPMLGRREFYNLSPKILKLMYRSVKKQTHPRLKEVFEEIKRGVENNRLPKNLPYGPVHVDIKPDNELFFGEELTGIIDFGNMYIDSLVFDIGKTIMWNCIENHSINKNLTKAFLKGYNKYRKLSKKELPILNQAILFSIYSHIWVDLYHVPLKYVPEKYTLSLVKDFLPVARKLEKEGLSSS